MIKHHTEAIQREIREKYGVEADVEVNIWAREKTASFALNVREELKKSFQAVCEYHHKYEDFEAVQAHMEGGTKFTIFCKKEKENERQENLPDVPAL